MAARTFETLVNDFIDDYGIGGGGPLETQSGYTEAVDGQTGDLKRAIRWIRDAWEEIALLWTNWDFLWFEWEPLAGDATPGLAAASQEPALPTFEVRHWDRSSFVLNRSSDTNAPLGFMEWREWRAQFNRGSVSSGTPRYITELPDGTLRCELTASAAMDFYGNGWKRPTRMTVDADVPDLPSVYDTIIIKRAAISYANHYDSAEDLEGAEADFIVLKAKLEADQLEGMDFENMSSPDYDLSREIPGQDSPGTIR